MGGASVKKGVIFTMEDAKRYGVIEALWEGKMSNGEAAAALSLSKRQIQRMKKKVAQRGPCGLIHGNRGRPSSRVLPWKDHVISLVKEKYSDFNFSHLAETLEEEEHLLVSRETLRLWLRPLGYGGKIRKQPHHRKRRRRSEREGHMLFLDGSPHRWFGEERSTLLLATDDATGKPLYGLFQKEEDLKGCFLVVGAIFVRYGLPVCFYLDRASQFTTTRHGGLHVSQIDTGSTQFERAMGELGVRLIFADSPQARGRGERINQTFQDRLVSELRLHRVIDAKHATRYLNEIFIPKFSKRFGVEPGDTTPAWRQTIAELPNILCTRYQRKVNNDNTISVKGQIIQLLPTKTRRHFVKALVTVNHWTDDSWHVFHETYGEIPCELIPVVNPAGALHRLRAGRRERLSFGMT
jgi:transposase